MYYITFRYDNTKDEDYSLKYKIKNFRCNINYELNKYIFSDENTYEEFAIRLILKKNKNLSLKNGNQLKITIEDNNMVFKLNKLLKIIQTKIKTYNGKLNDNKFKVINNFLKYNKMVFINPDYRHLFFAYNNVIFDSKKYMNINDFMNHHFHDEFKYAIEFKINIIINPNYNNIISSYTIIKELISIKILDD